MAAAFREATVMVEGIEPPGFIQEERTRAWREGFISGLAVGITILALAFALMFWLVPGAHAETLPCIDFIGDACRQPTIDCASGTAVCKPLPPVVESDHTYTLPVEKPLLPQGTSSGIIISSGASTQRQCEEWGEPEIITVLIPQPFPTLPEVNTGTVMIPSNDVLYYEVVQARHCKRWKP